MERKSNCGLLVLGLAAVLVLAACGGGSTPLVETRGSGPTLGNEPLLMSPAELRAEASLIGQPIYWAGPRKGYEYEFQRTSNGYVYVRYLPRGLPAGATGTFQTVAIDIDNDRYTLNEQSSLTVTGGRYRVSLNANPFFTDLRSAKNASGADVTALKFDGYGRPDQALTAKLFSGDHYRIVTVDASTGAINVTTP